MPQEPIVKELAQGKFSCESLWLVGTMAVRKHALTVIDSIAEHGQTNGQSKAQVLAELKKKFQIQTDAQGNLTGFGISDDEALLLLINEVTGRLILSELSQMNPSIIRPAASKVPPMYYFEDDKSIAGDPVLGETQQLRMFSSGWEWEGKGDFLNSMLSLPYVQGAVLYFLALSYPFFALALVVPGRHGTFMLWFGLWAWVKSWDFGFAVVMLVDDLLYILMPHSAPIYDDTLAKPAEALKAMLSVDPTYSVHTYYTIMATLLGAVPIVTGVIIKKGGGEIMHAVSQGYQNFGGRIGNAMSLYQRSMRAQSFAASYQTEMNNAMAGALTMEALEKSGWLDSFTKAQAHGVLQKAINQGGNKGVMGVLNNFGSATAGLAKSQQQRIAAAKLKAYLQNVAHEKSMEADMRRLASYAHLMGQFSHAWQVDFAYEEQFKVTLEQWNTQSGKAADAAVNRFIDNPLGFFGNNLPGFISGPLSFLSKPAAVLSAPVQLVAYGASAAVPGIYRYFNSSGSGQTPPPTPTSTSSRSLT